MHKLVLGKPSLKFPSDMKTFFDGVMYLGCADWLAL